MPFDPAHRPRLAALGGKVLLGSDFPSIPYAYAHQLAALHRLDLGNDWLRAVLWGNGARLFGVEGA
jgi:predicted TIM-barrel fold metal-dependent hydrolase